MVVDGGPKRRADDESGGSVDSQVAGRRDLDKIIGSKLKHSLRASQEITWVDLDGNGNGDDLPDPDKKAEVEDEQGAERKSKKQSSKSTQEVLKPLSEPLKPLFNSRGGSGDADHHHPHSFDPHDEVVVRDRVDSISNELPPSFGNNENGMDDAKYDKATGGKRKMEEDKTACSSPTPSEINPPKMYNSNNNYTTINNNLSLLHSTMPKDPFQTMYDSKYTSYGRERSVEGRQGSARNPQGAQDIFKKWWLLFCILFVLCIARWFV